MKEKVQIQFGMVFFLLLIIFCGQRVKKTTFQEQIRNHNIHGKILKEQNCTYMKKNYHGKLSNQQQKEITEKWLNLFHGDVVAEWEIEGMQNYYIKTKKLQKGIVVGEDVINLNIAFSYHEQAQKTICYIATPILNLDY